VNAVVDAALPARSVAELEGVQIILAVLLTVRAVVLGVPKVIVTTPPDWTIDDAVPVAPKVTVEFVFT
jgi:hypothetical protein